MRCVIAMKKFVTVTLVLAGRGAGRSHVDWHGRRRGVLRVRAACRPV
jgi:hypothetical protein